MLQAVEKAGVFAGYLEDLVYTPKTLKALQSVQAGALGTVLWARSRETHPGPHSDWFWDKQQAGGGAIIDMGCHCIEIARNFIGKDIRPVEVMCWGDTQVHPIDAEDHAVGMVRYENGAIGQFECSWTFRGGMDLRDEVSGTEGTIWLNHWLRTGFEMFTATGQNAYVAEKAEGDRGWLFPVGDE
jgi:predicted dehydrogenase